MSDVPLDGPLESQTYAELLSDAAARVPGDEVKITIRDFIGYWEARRRGSWVVERIQMALDEYGLATVPSFENGWIDNTIVLFPLQRALTHAGAPETADLRVEEIGPIAQVQSNTAQRFADLPSADAGVTSIGRDTTICKAQSLMIQNDYSQLPVVSGRELHGAISWESISRARVHKPAATLKDAIVPAIVVSLDDEVLPHVGDIIRKGFVFVRRRDRTINGIVTTTDLSAAFERLAGPFLLVGDVERRLRRVITATFSLPELQAVQAATDEGRSIESVENMTAGEYIRLLDNPERWHKLGWEVDRNVFVRSLQAYRELRNEVMHFSPDPLEEAKLALVRNLLAWLRTAVPDTP